MRKTGNIIRKTLFILSMIISLHGKTFAQVETDTYKITTARLESYYNVGDYAAIYSMFSPSMQRFLPIDKTREFFADLKNQAGNMHSRRFDHYHLDYAIYETKFEKGTMALHIAIEEDSTIGGLFVKPFEPDLISKPERNITKMRLPFNDEWTISWGGDTKKLNHHVESKAQKNAFDILITDSNGKSFKTDGSNNEDYYAFGKEILAPCDGEVVLAVDGVKDNLPGTRNPTFVTGNTVIIRTVNNEYLFFAHFKQFSVKVKEGQKVKRGHVLGLCGNSGNSSEPHLHFHLQNMEDMNAATGVKCYFDQILVDQKIRKDYSPVKDERVMNIK